jgi:hypothetical protein
MPPRSPCSLAAQKSVSPRPPHHVLRRTSHQASSSGDAILRGRSRDGSDFPRTLHTTGSLRHVPERGLWWCVCRRAGHTCTMRLYAPGALKGSRTESACGEEELAVLTSGESAQQLPAPPQQWRVSMGPPDRRGTQQDRVRRALVTNGPHLSLVVTGNSSLARTALRCVALLPAPVDHVSESRCCLHARIRALSIRMTSPSSTSALVAASGSARSMRYRPMPCAAAVDAAVGTAVGAAFGGAARRGCERLAEAPFAAHRRGGCRGTATDSCVASRAVGAGRS